GAGAGVEAGRASLRDLSRRLPLSAPHRPDRDARSAGPLRLDPGGSERRQRGLGAGGGGEYSAARAGGGGLASGARRGERRTPRLPSRPAGVRSREARGGEDLLRARGHAPARPRGPSAARGVDGAPVGVAGFLAALAGGRRRRAAGGD